MVAGAVAVLVLCLQLLSFQFQPSNGSDDFTAYVSNGRSLVTGAPYGMPEYILNPHYDRADSGQGAYPPGYPLALIPALLLGGDQPVRAAALANCVFYAGFAGLLVLFAFPTTGLLGAGGAGLVAGLAPYFHNQGTLRAPTESFYLLVLMATFLAERQLWPGRRAGAGGVAAVGAGIALAALTRITGILLGPALILADLIRRRRLAWPTLLAGMVAGLLFTVTILSVSLDYVVQNYGVLRTPAAPGQASPDLVQVVLDNVVRMPGNLTALWTYPGPDAPADGGTWALLRKAATLPMLALAALGFVLQLRRMVTMAETYFVLQTLLLLNLTAILSSPRYWLPVSAVALVYAIGGGRALAAFLGRRILAGPGGVLAGTVGALATVALGLGLALGANAVAAGRPDAYPLTEARAVDAFARLARELPPGSVIVARRPRTVVFYGHRHAVDYHLPPSDPAFWNWAAEVRATHLLLSHRPAGRRRGGPADGAGAGRGRAARGAGLVPAALHGRGGRALYPHVRQ